MRTFIVIPLVLLLASCGGRIENDQLVGRYVWNDGRIDTLEIRGDGSYEYWTIVPGRKLINNGKWKLNEAGEVIFEMVNPPFLTDVVTEGTWVSRVKVSGDEVRIMRGSDLFLKKVSGGR